MYVCLSQSGSQAPHSASAHADDHLPYARRWVLEDYRSRCIGWPISAMFASVALAFKEQILKTPVPTTSNDQAMDILITPDHFVRASKQLQD